MKNHWGFKLIALILAVVSAATLAVSAVSVAANTYFDLYHTDLDTKIQALTADEIDEYLYEAAMTAAVQYVKEVNTKEGTQERELWENYVNYTWHHRGIWPEYEYTISQNGSKLKSTRDDTIPYAQSYTVTVAVENAIITDLGSACKDFPYFDELPINYKWTDYEGNELPGLDSSTQYYELICVYDDSWEYDEFTEVDWDGGEATAVTEPPLDYGMQRVYRLEWLPNQEFSVQIHLMDADMAVLTSQVEGLTLLTVTSKYVNVDIAVLIASVAVLLLSIVYLCFAAGKKPGTDKIRPRGTNCIPLDLFAVVAGLGATLAVVLGCESLGSAARSTTTQQLYLWGGAYALCAACLALCVTLFLTALCAQVRLGNRAWLRHTIIGLSWSAIWSWIKKAWNWFWGCLKKAIRFVQKLMDMLPLVWQWLVAYGVLLVLVLCAISVDSGLALLFVAVLGVPLVLYSAYAFGKLRDAAKRMSSGDLDTKIDTRQDFLYGCFGEFAGDLNTLGDTCVEAAVERTKSERMKSELITNVSHDIKTPLTSIINYVDLLQRAQTEEQRTEYLEVLDRQSQRLKKLIEDLMEMSKASSGNVSAELMQADVAEAVNQALGEFADRLDSQNLNVVFRRSEESVTASFDGKLLWRVMSNILGNVVKYALPGTRVYVDIVNAENRVFLSFKNISREPLNITPDELMERFVRGDASRNSEGNGLGLNIAKSLMEVQGGDLNLTVDGDLFKVTLTLNEK